MHNKGSAGSCRGCVLSLDSRFRGRVITLLLQHPFYAALTEEGIKETEVSKSVTMKPHLFKYVKFLMGFMMLMLF
jgi:hypothetical protein